jgi:hypothetical protein
MIVWRGLSLGRRCSGKGRVSKSYAEAKLSAEMRRQSETVKREGTALRCLEMQRRCEATFGKGRVK